MCQIIDLKLKVIEEEIENALEQYSDPVYKNTFAIPEWRQKLLGYILSKVPGFYLVMGDTQQLIIKDHFSYHSLELRLQVETHIHNGICQIFEEIALCRTVQS